MSETVTFVHVTDLHIGKPGAVDDHLYSDTDSTLKAILADIRTMVPQPRFIVASGDLTNHGEPEAYERLKAIVAEAGLDMPILYTLGNHDRREGFYRAMLGRETDTDQPYDHATVVDGIHIILVDTSAPFRIGGCFEPGQTEWLAGELDRQPDLPKLLVMHHAPALDMDDPRMEWESLTFADTEKLKTLLEGRSDILGILCGHIHYDRVSHWHGIPVVVGIGQHAATDVLYLHEGLRMVSGASFAIGTIRPSGLTVSFVPQPAERAELKTYTFAGMAELVKRYETRLAAE